MLEQHKAVLTYFQTVIFLNCLQASDRPAGERKRREVDLMSWKLYEEKSEEITGNLAACPFCGNPGKARIYFSEEYGDEKDFEIGCSNGGCFLLGLITFCSYDDDLNFDDALADAISEWNRRAS